MTYALPAHVRDVQKAVDAAQIHKDAVVCDIFDLAGDNLPFFQGFKQLLAHGVTFFFKEDTAGDDDIAATAVDFQDPEIKCLVDQ